MRQHERDGEADRVRSIALVSGPNCALETQAIRAVLESLGAQVVTYWIGRPDDLIRVLDGRALTPDTDLIILSFHGDDGVLLMPVLESSIYLEEEPRTSFGPDEIMRYAQLNGRSVITTGCTLGSPAFAQALFRRRCSVYIGPEGYPDGNTVLMFVVRLCYEYIRQGGDLLSAYELARSMNADTAAFRLYRHLT